MPTVKISDAEWEVMQVVWSLRQAAAADVIERLAATKGWSHRTIRTLLARLVQKNALSAEQDGNRYIYRAIVSRRRCVREAGRSFLDKVFGGDPTELLVHFVHDSNMSDDDIQQLQQLLDEKIKRRG